MKTRPTKEFLNTPDRRFIYDYASMSLSSESKLKFLDYPEPVEGPDVPFDMRDGHNLVMSGKALVVAGSL